MWIQGTRRFSSVNQCNVLCHFHDKDGDQNSQEAGCGERGRPISNATLSPPQFTSRVVVTRTKKNRSYHTCPQGPSLGAYTEAHWSQSTFTCVRLLWMTLCLSLSRNLLPQLGLPLLVVSAPPLARYCACRVWSNTRGGVSEPGPVSVLALGCGTVCLGLCRSPVPKICPRYTLRMTYLTSDCNVTPPPPLPPVIISPFSERPEHAVIAWSDCAIQTSIMVIMTRMISALRWTAL